MENNILKITIMLVVIGLLRIPSANSRSLTSGHRHSSRDALERRRRPGPAAAATAAASDSLRALLAVLSTPELLLLAADSGRRSATKQQLKEFLHRFKADANLRDSVDQGDDRNPIPIPKGLALEEIEAAKKELKTLQNHRSALLENPYVEIEGLNDFLVIDADSFDPYSRYVPNDIYYNSQKTCVNWLDSCNEKGMRQKLLSIVNTPYRRQLP